MGKNRRGSSTRKYKQTNLSTLPIKPAKAKADVGSKSEQMLLQLERMLKNGVNKKGKPLTDDDITRIKTRIANTEYTLGITHD